MTITGTDGKVEICKGANGRITIDLSAGDAERLLGWMELSAVCLQTWPRAAQDILVWGKDQALI